MKICSRCGAEVQDQAQFCTVCGASLPAVSREKSGFADIFNDLSNWIPGQAAGQARAGQSRTGPGGLRYNGLYRCPSGSYSYYFRFFPDGTLAGVSSTGTPAQVARWLTAGYENHGNWRLDEGRLIFDLTSKSGVVAYCGRILPGGDLELDSHSFINGYNSKGARYQFCPVDQ